VHTATVFNVTRLSIGLTRSDYRLACHAYSFGYELPRRDMAKDACSAAARVLRRY